MNDSAGGIPCPKCGKQDSSVVESYTLASMSATRRRRQCVCGHRFTTYETLAEPKPKRGPKANKSAAPQPPTVMAKADRLALIARIARNS